MTKKINDYQNMEKEYEGTLVLGKTTPSIDLETAVDSEQDISQLTEAQVRQSTGDFTGTIEQIPPAFSAVKVDGQRVYHMARKGQEVKLNPRIVEISEFSITECTFPGVRFKVVCSKGTYIRSLVRDLGNQLQVGAYLSSLTRTRIGPYKLSQAHQLEELIVQITADTR
jgi:tRNA pseudouridine55 synthase